MLDPHVKERLVGATILVVLIVLIVPELLSGPKPMAPVAPLTLPANSPEPVRNVRVDLATSRATLPVSMPDEAPPAPAVVPEPAPAPAPAVVPEPAVLETAASPPKSAVTVAAKDARGAWAVQLGSFVSKTNAEKLAHRLQEQGSYVYVLSSGAAGPLRFRVRVGPMADRATAERAVAKFKALGHAASLVAPPP